ncbi:MAG: hypothetical protein P9M00_12640 [Candidatus Tritonobacter lacicola]|nr:hypothetical protein [Candidatus Tritonobacter lacicola]
MKWNQSSVAVIVAAVMAFAGVAGAADEQIQVKAQVIFATEGEMIRGAVPMEKGNPLYKQLKKLFLFKNYGIITTAYTYVLSGRKAEMSLKGIMFLKLLPVIEEGKEIRLELKWGENHYSKAEKRPYTTSILSTTIVSADGATTLLGGKQESFPERGERREKLMKIGSLILAVTPTIIEE